MNDRRAFLVRSLAVAAGGMVASTEGFAKEQPPELARLMRERLALELGDVEVASAVASALLDVGFQWAAPARPAVEMKTIVAYSFGNRLVPGASDKTLPEPGPVNEALADAVFALQKLNHAAVFAQWEIARLLRSKHGLTEVVSIEPVVGKDGALIYLSTDGVAEAVVAHAGGKASSLGVVGVVGHRDHAKRCVLTSRARGMDAYVAREVVLPVAYDAASGQPWTRRRDLYLLSDMAAQMAMLRAERIARAFPRG